MLEIKSIHGKVLYAAECGTVLELLNLAARLIPLEAVGKKVSLICHQSD